MKKLAILSLASVVAVSAFVGCNTSTYEAGENTSSSVAVYSFKLSKDDSVLANLDTVFFSIDLVKGEIFNADSMPYGTRTDKLVPVIQLLDGVSRCDITSTDAEGKETVHNYVKNSTDTIDFSNGPVKLTLVSPDGLTSKDYQIRVNVHQVKSDSLVWTNTAMRTLPTTLQNPTAQRTAQLGDELYCLTVQGSSASIAITDNPGADDWTVQSVTLPSGADVESFAAAGDALYILASGILYRSTDRGASWSSTGRRWNSIYGAYGDRILGAVNGIDGWMVEQYPSGNSLPLPDGMPVSGVSVPIAFDFDMSTAPQMLFTGGVCADGSLSADTWAFDGTNFAKLSNTPLPKGMKNMTLVSFYTFHTNSIFITVRHSVLMAFGGNDGKDNSRTVYTSNDYGMTWAEGASLIQLPEQIPSMQSAQTFAYNTTMQSRSSAWQEFDFTARIPAPVVLMPLELPASRATEPVTEWECPYIYLFGGTKADGTLYNTVWRGTIHRMMFKPLI
ncbi:MAG: hypothetical protein K2F78_02925 [Muribaculaceae bacterium]|nr:hypothetical protein [Muribaculaceae bacterium]